MAMVLEFRVRGIYYLGDRRQLGAECGKWAMQCPVPSNGYVSYVLLFLVMFSNRGAWSIYLK